MSTFLDAPGRFQHHACMQKRMKAHERKAQIETIARSLFAQRGLHGVSVDEIAAAVGVSPAVIYRHFPSKEALYESVLAQIACTREDYIEVALKGESDFDSVLQRMTVIYLKSVFDNCDYLRMEMYSALEGGAATQQFFQHRWKVFRDYIETELAELISSGELPPQDVSIASLAYQALVREWIYAHCLLEDERLPKQAIEQHAETLVGLLMRLLRPA